MILGNAFSVMQTFLDKQGLSLMNFAFPIMSTILSETLSPLFASPSTMPFNSFSLRAVILSVLSLSFVINGRLSIIFAHHSLQLLHVHARLA